MHMHKIRGPILLIAILILSTSPAALADATGTNVSVSGFFGSEAANSPFSGPNDTFGLTFVVPNNMTLENASGEAIWGMLPVTFSLGSSTQTINSEVDFYSTTMGGLFDVNLMFDGHDFLWGFYGPQIFDSASGFIAGVFRGNAMSNFQVDFRSMSFLHGVSGAVTPNVPGSNDPSPTPAPEPASLLLLGTGLLGLGTLTRRLKSHGTAGQ